MNTSEQNAICEEFLKYTFQLVQNRYWYGHKQLLIQESEEKNGKRNIVHISPHGIEQLDFQYVVKHYFLGDENAALNIWYQEVIFKDNWFGHWINIHYPDFRKKGLNVYNLKYYLKNIDGIPALRMILGLDSIVVSDDIEIK